MNEIKMSAKTYDEALTKALIELQTTSDNVVIDILEEGSEGLFGLLGSKPWVINVKKKEASDNKKEIKSEIKEEKAEVKEEVKTEVKTEIKETKTEEIKEEIKNEDNTSAPEEGVDESAKEQKEIIPISNEDAEKLIKAAETFLTDVFEKMNMSVELESDFKYEANELNVVMSGDDMGVLIGKRGQTLDSLQYLTSLVVNKHIDNYIRVKLDTENYRERREEKLVELANNIAAKVKRTKRSVELEPMNPYERRVIHSALQGDDFVTTISEGDEPYRHVIVILKKDPKKNNRRRHH